MSEADSGFVRALSALGDAGVAFVIVGVGGINFYARTPADAFATLDVDALVEMELEESRPRPHTLGTFLSSGNVRIRSIRVTRPLAYSQISWSP